MDLVFQEIGLDTARKVDTLLCSTRLTENASSYEPSWIRGKVSCWDDLIHWRYLPRDSGLLGDEYAGKPLQTSGGFFIAGNRRRVLKPHCRSFELSATRAGP